MANIEGESFELDVLEFTDGEEPAQPVVSLSEAKAQQALLTEELNQSGVIGLVVTSLPEEWRWGIVNPKYHQGVGNLACRLVAYRDRGSIKVKVRDLESVSVTFDPDKVLVISGQNETYSGSLPVGESGLETVKTAVNIAFSAPNREPTYIGFVQHLMRNPRPIPTILPETP